MSEAFTDQQKQHVREHLARFNYWFEEWDDGTSVEEDISNLTSSNWSNFIEKLRDWIYNATLEYSNVKGLEIIKTKVNFKLCSEQPHHRQQELCNLYLNGIIPQLPGNHEYVCFAILFHMYRRMIEKIDQFSKYDSDQIVSPFVESLLPKVAETVQHDAPGFTEPKRRRYIINGILY